jgi:threonine dehydrogenase-like Zn-dependent dehydrogenase
MEMSKRMGAHVVLDPKQCDVVAEIKKLTGGGADVAIEALGLQATFENALRCLRAGGTLSSLGVYSGKLQVPLADGKAAANVKCWNEHERSSATHTCAPHLARLV